MRQMFPSGVCSEGSECWREDRNTPIKRCSSVVHVQPVRAKYNKVIHCTPLSQWVTLITILIDAACWIHLLLLRQHFVQTAGNEGWQLAGGHCVRAKSPIIGLTRRRKDVRALSLLRCLSSKGGPDRVKYVQAVVQKQATPITVFLLRPVQHFRLWLLSGVFGQYNYSFY